MGNNSSDYREKMSERMLEFAVRIMKLESKLCKTYLRAIVSIRFISRSEL